MKSFKRLVLISFTVAVTTILLETKAKATEVDVGVGYNRVSIDWIDDAKFKVNMLTLEGTVWHNNIGLRGQYGQSDRGSNESDEAWATSEAKLKSFQSIQIVGRKAITDNWELEASYGYMKYDQAVTNFQEVGYSNVDEGSMYSYGITYYLNDRTTVRTSYSKYHEKDKGIHGVELTSGVAITINHTY